MPPFSLFEKRSKAALHLPANIRLAKERAKFSLALRKLNFGRGCWIAQPSNTSSPSPPSFQIFSLLSRQVMCSFVLEVLCGFCSRSIWRTVAAIKATDSNAEAEANTWKMRDNSPTNSFSTLPSGTAKQFLLQCTTSE